VLQIILSGVRFGIGLLRGLYLRKDRTPQRHVEASLVTSSRSMVIVDLALGAPYLRFIRHGEDDEGYTLEEENGCTDKS
jgi:hypothetical protein